MSRLIGYVANRADRMRDALYQERAVLRQETAPANASGWGIGFYHGDEVLHKKRPTRAERPAQPAEDPAEAAQIRAIGTPLANFCIDIQSLVQEYATTQSQLPGFDLPDEVKQLAEDTIEGIKDGSIAIPIGE